MNGKQNRRCGITEIAEPKMQERCRKGDRGRWISLVILCAGFFMIILGTTIVNVALPSIRSDLGFSQPSLGQPSGRNVL
jgi:hypothetical protein